jgi:hypothetical protein
MNDVNLFDGAEDDAPAPEPELVLVPAINVSKYNVRLNGVHVPPGGEGLAEPRDIAQWLGRGLIKLVAADGE